MANLVDIVDGVGHVAEIASFAVVFRIPVVGQFDLREFVARGSKKDQGKAPLRILVSAQFDEAESVTIECERGVDIGDADHRV